MADKDHCLRYTVKRGDSYYLIAQRLGVRLRELLEANLGIPPARLMVGDVLCVPHCGGADTPAGDQEDGQNPPEAGNGGDSGNDGGASGDTGNDGAGGGNSFACPANRRAVVQEGQTASDLLLRYNLSYHTLKTANSGKDLEHLQGGDVVCVPEDNIACPLPASIVLGDNDSLESVAMMYNVPIASLLRENPCLAPEDFRAGATVRLPD